MLHFSKDELKKRFSGWRRAFMAVAYFVCAYIFISWATDFYMKEAQALMLTAATVLLFFFGGGFLRASYLFIIGFSVLFQNHIVTNYSYPFARIGREILVITSETNWLEFFTYLQLITWQEYSMFLGLVAFCYLTYRFGPYQTEKRYPALLALTFLGFGLWNDLGAPVYAYRQEMSESAAIIDRYKKFSFQAKDLSNQDRSTYIIVIGETHRQDYFEEYGYTPEYSPHLLQARKKGTLIPFSDLVSGYGYTTGAVPLIMTRKPVDYENRFYEEKSIISAFKEAGYKTYSLSYEKKTQPEDDAMNMIFLEADQYINHVDKSGSFDDVGMLPHIRKILDDTSVKKKLVVIKMIGAHYLYEDRYPEKFDICQPSFKTVRDFGEAANNPLYLKNSYRNAVMYSANFVDTLASWVYAQKEPVFMSFMSDHGTTLFDDGTSKYVGRAKGGYHIAFFLTANDAWWHRTDDEVIGTLKANRTKPITQEYFLETYLSLAQIDYFDKRPQYNITSEQFKPAKDRQVWTGLGLEAYNDLAPEKPAKEEKSSK